MKRNFNIFISKLILMTILFYPLKVEAEIIQTSNKYENNKNINLILDTLNYNEMPKNFRKTSDLSKIENNKDLNIKGLSKLNISGSQQFSGLNLSLVIKSIATSIPITIVDLRQESHGFINDIPISWANANNDTNIDLSKKEVLEDETKRLNGIELNKSISFYNHPNITIIPKKIINENELANSASLEYIRIPVTDGKIPTDDMVDYFLSMVNQNSKEKWFHFHCKQGVGRSTTFMIMYDAIKNSKEVELKDIIERQLRLADFDEKEIKSFYNDERINFLNNFYKFTKENSNTYNIKWSDWKKNSAINTFSSATSIQNNEYIYMKNPKIPTNLYVISEDIMSYSERTMISSLQGIVNSHCSFQIYITTSKEPSYQVWLDDLKNNYGIQYNNILDPWKLIDIYKGYINGYVLYSNKNKNDPSINNASSLASLKNSIVVNETIENKVKAHGIKNNNGDCRNTDKLWAFNNLWDSGLNHSTLIQLSPNIESALRDYAIMTKSLIFYEDSISDTSLREKVFSSTKSDSTCFGWGPDEFINVSTASKYGVSMIASDYSYNLTILSSFPSLPISQKSIANIPIKRNAHYITFIMSDGDNQQWNLGTNFTSSNWYNAPNRGDFNLGWSISPSLYYLAPTVFNLYYQNATSEVANDYFIVPPSGNAYIYPSKFEPTSLNPYIDRLNKYMQKVDEKYISIIDDSSFHNISLWDNFTSKNNIHGLFYLDYHKHNKYKGEIIWSNDKPIVSCRDLLWEGIESEDELIKNINLRINNSEVGIHNPNSYTLVYVHTWSKNLNDIKYVIDILNKNPNIEIVTPKTFMELIKKNVNH